MVAYRKPKTEETPRLSPQEYLAWERQQETKHEYDNGVIVAMAGASWNYNLIAGDLERLLGNNLLGSPCIVVGRDQRVWAPECSRYFYPDLVVVCGEPEFEDSELDNLRNPSLIIEVLSESTEARDRGEKFTCYESIPTLTDYLLISQDVPRIERFSRQGDGWFRTVTAGQDGVLVLPTLNCTLRLAEVYARVQFETVESKPSAPKSTEKP